MDEITSSQDQLAFEYVNWSAYAKASADKKGERGVRRVKPIKLWWGSTQWHPEPQWLLKAMDLDKDAERDFAVKEIVKFMSAAD